MGRVRHRLVWGLFIYSLLLGICSSFTHAQGQAVSLADRFNLRSEVLQEDRKVQVFLPNGYSDSSDSCHVAYVLDGEWNFQYVATLVDKLVAAGEMPRTIVIGIENRARSRDLTPAGNNDNLQRFGGAERFHDFIVTELKPWVEEKYRTHPYNLLLGHSFGGLFSIYSMLEDASVFQGVIALSPSLGRNDEQQVVRAAAQFEKRKDSAKQVLYLAVGNEGGLTLSCTKHFVDVLESVKPESVKYRFDHLQDESHESITVTGFQEGLRFIYEGYDPTGRPEFDDLFQIQNHYRRLSQRFGHRIIVPEHFFQKFTAEQIGLRDLDYAFYLLQQFEQNYPNSLPLARLYGDAHLLNGDFAQALTFYSKLVDKGISEPSLLKIVEAIKKM